MILEYNKFGRELSIITLPFFTFQRAFGIVYGGVWNNVLSIEVLFWRWRIIIELRPERKRKYKDYGYTKGGM